MTFVNSSVTVEACAHEGRCGCSWPRASACSAATHLEEVLNPLIDLLVNAEAPHFFEEGRQVEGVACVGTANDLLTVTQCRYVRLIRTRTTHRLLLLRIYSLAVVREKLAHNSSTFVARQGLHTMHRNEAPQRARERKRVRARVRASVRAR